MNIALISPNFHAYTESFIEAHKQLLKGNIFYYYGGELPNKLEGGVVINSRKKRILDILKGHYNLNRFSLAEQALLTSFKYNKIDIIFAEYGGTGEKMVNVCKKLRLPLIVHFHGFDASRYDQFELNNNYKGIFSYASYLVCVSRQMEQKLIDLGCPAEKVVYNVYGPRTDFFEVKPRFSKPQFVFAGRFVDKKNPHFLILCFIEVLKHFSEAQLVMAGDGPLRESCIKLVSYYGLEKNISFPGIIDAIQFKNYLSESIAFVQYSATAFNGDSEGTPVVILEAGAAGLPVISTKHAGISDVVVDGKTGFLVEEKDSRTMSEKMIMLLQHKSVARTAGKEARKRIRSNFSLKRHIDLHNTLIQKAVREF